MWLATRNDDVGVWNQAGGSFATEYGGLWDDDGLNNTEDGKEVAEWENGSGKECQDQVGTEGAVVAGGVGDGCGDGTTIGAACDGHADEDMDDGDAGSSSTGVRNELVFIGLGMDEDALRADLERCLLTEEEMAGGPTEWERRLSDPFPAWK